jgi:hypothetical protein
MCTSLGSKEIRIEVRGKGGGGVGQKRVEEEGRRGIGAMRKGWLIRHGARVG